MMSCILQKGEEKEDQDKADRIHKNLAEMLGNVTERGIKTAMNKNKRI